MTKDVNDPTTWPEWLLLREVLEIVAAHCHADEAAADLVLKFAHKGHFRRWRYSDDEDPQHRGIDPRHWGKSILNVSYPVDFINSCVAYVRESVSPYGTMGAVEDKLREGGFLPSPYYMMTLVRLHRDHVASMLRAVGFLPEPTPAAEPITAPPAEPARSEPAAELAVEPVVEPVQSAPIESAVEPKVEVKIVKGEDGKKLLAKLKRENPQGQEEELSIWKGRLYDLATTGSVRVAWTFEGFKRRWRDPVADAGTYSVGGPGRKKF